MTSPNGLDWLLDDLLRRVPSAQKAVVLSADGLLMGRSATIPRDEAEQLAAMASGLQGLAKGAGRHFAGGGVRQTLVEMELCYLVVTAAGSGAYLAVLAASDTDLGQLAYEMNLMVRRVGAVLTAQPRSDDPLADLIARRSR
jgi:predicted regulator of Ras-like GTPase activity (Roadblock/LC7/MglB family)